MPAKKMFTAIEINGPIAFSIFRFFFIREISIFLSCFVGAGGRLIVTEDFQVTL